ncbi:MAG: Asd/ArgC dimerization domain-containing protein [Pseudomonadota bacterium]|nr:Asd/ArgC dimerization domain-containing protein [Pseudomonadota bacterium]
MLTALDASEMVIASLRAYGSAARSPRVDTVPFRGQNVGVEPLSALASVKPDLVILCVPPAVAGKIAPGLVARGVIVLDVGDATAGVLDAPLVLPGIQSGLPDGVARAGAVRLPSSVGALLAALCQPLVGIGLTSCTGVVSLAASARGRGGMEELAQQVVATLNNQDPPRRVFVDGLAFDTLPEDTAMDEWSGTEQLAAAEVEALTGLPAASVGVQVAIQPLFAGVSAGLHLRGVTVDAVEAAWRATEGLVAVSRTARLRPRSTIGKPGVWWGRLRADPAGDGVFVWAVTDDLYGAGLAAARVATWLSTAGLLGVA